jgi:hypothetical protein
MHSSSMPCFLCTLFLINEYCFTLRLCLFGVFSLPRKMQKYTNMERNYGTSRPRIIPSKPDLVNERSCGVQQRRAERLKALQSLEHLQPSPCLGPRTPFFTSGRRYSAQPCPRFLVFARIWAFIHPASPDRPRLSEACSGNPDETKTRETASGPAVSARERVVPRH